MANGQDYRMLDAEADKAIARLQGVGTDRASETIIQTAFLAAMYKRQNRGGVFVPYKALFPAFTGLGVGAVTAAWGWLRGPGSA